MCHDVTVKNDRATARASATCLVCPCCFCRVVLSCPFRLIIPHTPSAALRGRESRSEDGVQSTRSQQLVTLVEPCGHVVRHISLVSSGRFPCSCRSFTTGLAEAWTGVLATSHAIRAFHLHSSLSYRSQLIQSCHRHSSLWPLSFDSLVPHLQEFHGRVSRRTRTACHRQNTTGSERCRF